MMYMGADDRVQTLRNIAKIFFAENLLGSALIRTSSPDCQLVEYASVIPTVLRHRITKSEFRSHCRWILLPEIWKTSDANGPYMVDEDVFGMDSKPTVVLEDANTGKRYFQFGKDAALRRSIDMMARTGEPCGFLVNSAILNDDRHFIWRNVKPQLPAMKIEELCSSANRMGRQWDESYSTPRWELGESRHIYAGATYRLVFGQPQASAIFLPCHESDAFNPDPPLSDPLSTEQVTSILRMRCFTSEWLDKYLRTLSKPTLDSRYAHYFRSLEALAGASAVYQTLPNADIDLNFGKGLHSFAWAEAFQNNQHKLNVSIYIFSFRPPTECSTQ